MVKNPASTTNTKTSKRAGVTGIRAVATVMARSEPNITQSLPRLAATAAPNGLANNWVSPRPAVR